jgi:hypothetical protein
MLPGYTNNEVIAVNRKSWQLKILYLIIGFILIFTMGISCAKKQERPAQKETKDKIPQTLSKIQEDTQKITEELEKIQEEMKKPVEPVQQGNQQQGGDQQEGGQQGGSTPRKEQQGGGQQQKPEGPTANKKEKINKMWEGVTKKAEDIHKSWNDYETKAIEDGVGEQAIAGFENALNGMTIAVQSKDIMQALDKANQMFLYAADFLDMYKGNPDGEAARMRYYIQQAYLDAQEGNWSKAEADMEGGEPVFERLRKKVKLDEKDKLLIEKLSLSLEDMRSAIPDRDVELLKIKRDIALKNLDGIKEKAK